MKRRQKFSFNIVSEQIYSLDERVEQLLKNPYIHPFRKHLEISQAYRRDTEIKKWKIVELPMLHYHGINVDAKLVSASKNALRRRRNKIS